MGLSRYLVNYISLKLLNLSNQVLGLLNILNHISAEYKVKIDEYKKQYQKDMNKIEYTNISIQNIYSMSDDEFSKHMENIFDQNFKNIKIAQKIQDDITSLKAEINEKYPNLNLNLN